MIAKKFLSNNENRVGELTKLTIRVAITGVALFVAVVHVIWPKLTIDAITISALIISVIPWVQPLFKALEVPGVIKLEFQNMEILEERAETLGLLKNTDESVKTYRYSFEQLQYTDSTLALAGLRIELERALDGLARANGYQGNPRGIGNLLKHLVSKDLITDGESGVLIEIVGLLNSAVHGAEVGRDAANKAIDIGLGILRTLEVRTTSLRL